MRAPPRQGLVLRIGDRAVALVVGALQRMRSAGAARVDQDHVAVAARIGECRVRPADRTPAPTARGRRRSSRSDRARPPFRRHPRDRELDLPPRRRIVVLRHRQRRALRLDRGGAAARSASTARTPARRSAGGRRGRCPGSARLRAAGGEQQRGGERRQEFRHGTPPLTHEPHDACCAADVTGCFCGSGHGRSTMNRLAEATGTGPRVSAHPCAARSEVIPTSFRGDVFLAPDLRHRQAIALQRLETGIDHVRIAAQVGDVGVGRGANSARNCCT